MPHEHRPAVFRASADRGAILREADLFMLQGFVGYSRIPHRVDGQNIMGATRAGEDSV